MNRTAEKKALKDCDSVCHKNTSNKMINREEKNNTLAILICSINANAKVSKHESVLNSYFHIFQIQTIRKDTVEEVGLIN